MSNLLAWLLLAALLSAIFPSKSRKRTPAHTSAHQRTSAVTTVRIRPKRQAAPKKTPAFDMAYEYDHAAQQYYNLAESLMRDAERETDRTKANRLKCKAAEAILKGDRHALKAQQ